jgi:predicted aspartyl protease
MTLSKSFAAAFGALLLLWAGGAHAQCLSADNAAVLPGASDGAASSGPVRRDRIGRIVAPLRVNGAGPFRFIVDTGANRSALSQALADELGLSVVGAGDLHTVHGVTSAPLVSVDSFRYGDLGLGGNTVPVVRGPVLAGEHGLLGVDGMRGRRLRLDFENRCVEIGPTETPMWRRGWTGVQGRLRFGHLVVIEGRIGRQPVDVLIDTGSDSTLANTALRDQLGSSIRLNRLVVESAQAYSPGETATLNSRVEIPRFRMGPITILNVSAFVGDFHIFQLWELTDRPALLIGMDVLAQTRGLAIDYGDAMVYFKVARTHTTGSRLPSTNPGAGLIIGR